MSRFIGGRIGPPVDPPDGNPPGGVFSIDDQFYFNALDRWEPKGTANNPFTSVSEAFATGVYYIKPAGVSTAFQTYFDVSTSGGPWALTWIVTNNSDDQADWWDGDSSMSNSTGTNHFTTISTLGSTTSPTNKANGKNPLFDYVSFQDMMIVENHSGTTGKKTYRLNSTASFRSRFQNATGSNAVSSVLSSTGSFTTFNSSNLLFNYGLTDDGARIAADTKFNEAVGGISARVDGGRSFGWKGNLTRNDSSRYYNDDGTTTDHTVWIYIK